MEHMAERLAVFSRGKMRIDIYLNGQLGSEREMIEMLQVGSIAMTKVSAISLEGFSSGMRLFSIPYLFADSDHYWRVLDSDVGKSMLNTLGDVRLKGVGYYDAGSRSFYMSDVAVNTPQDLIGKKVRVLPSRTSIEMVEALGGAATPITWGELYTALQQGVVDGAENNPPSYFLSKHYEAAKYYTLDEHTSVPDVLVMSSAVFDRLSEVQKEWLNRAVVESVALQKKLWAEAETHALQQVKAAGVQVIYPDKKPFRAAVAAMRTAFRDSELGSIIKRVEDLEASP
tara:strand:- start:2449 stop:3303 length:855 start_codon:yes stop_codon:yes gene_type:complete